MRQRVERALSGSRKEGALVVIREPQRLLRGACERGVSSAAMQAGRTHDVRVAVRMPTCLHCAERAAGAEGVLLLSRDASLRWKRR